MRKIHCSSSSSSMELLPHDVLESILERLPAKSLLRFKCVSKKLKSTMESKHFQKRQMIHHGEADLQVILLSVSSSGVVVAPNIQVSEDESQVTVVKIPTESGASFVCETGCDGLVCLYTLYTSCLVANPATGWSRSFPPSRFQQLIFELGVNKFMELSCPLPSLGFGKDILTDTYKPVFLYNSSEMSLANATTCEVFDFTSNTWRYVFPASPHRIIANQEPFYFDGSLHWFTEGQETKILSFHLHTETFQLISDNASSPLPFVDSDDTAMCNLNNRFCVSEKKGLSQLIWFFDLAKDKKKKSSWVKLYSIDLNATSSWFGRHNLPIFVLALPPTTTGKKTNKLLLYDFGYDIDERKQQLVLHDPEPNSFDLLFSPKSVGSPLYYFQSLISISS